MKASSIAMESELLNNHHHLLLLQYAQGNQDDLGNGNDNLFKVTYHLRNEYNVRGTGKRS
jgi:hypothetical protein